ncbi:hypothetical protein Q3G72_027586 [Acer saccharum]|nr:hypothetical protein Q3G72_027586 [Acer saccharum]
MLGTGDLSPSVDDDDTELREADIVRQTRSSSYASQQQTTDGAGPSTVPVADRSVPFAPSSVPATDTTTPARRTRLRFAVPDHLERRFADVISAVEALREEVRKSERDRKESDRVRDEQHKELIRMIQTLQGTST